MFIQMIPSGPLETNAYVIACPQTRQAALIDAPPQSEQAIQAYLTAQNLQCQKILLTHSHWDHIGDVAALKKLYAVPVYIHALDRPNLEQPGWDQLPCWLSISGVQADGFLEEGTVIPVGHLSLQVLHTPGHSPGSLCLYEPQERVLFSGDTLFKGSMGRVSFPTSQPELMKTSLARLAQLPPETQVYPGHGPSTTIQAELNWLTNLN